MKKTHSIIFALTLVWCLVGTVASAASIQFEQQADVVQVGDVLTVAILLNTEGKTVNAIEAELTYGAQGLELREILDGESIVNFWVQPPKEIETGKVIFSGITPGGITGRDLNLLTLSFEAKKEQRLRQLLFRYHLTFKGSPPCQRCLQSTSISNHPNHSYL
jgi:hypothetical protein